jgi:hypothetical protein
MVGAYLASDAVPGDRRWALVSALERLDAADVLSAYLGRPQPYEAFESMKPAVERRLSTLHKHGLSAVDPVVVFPAPGRGSEALFSNSELSMRQLRTMLAVDGLVWNLKGAESTLKIEFTSLRPAGPGGRVLGLAVSSFHPQMGLRLAPPGAPGGLVIRRPVETYGELKTTIWYELTLRGAMVPPPGRWTLTLARSFIDAPRPFVKVERIAEDLLPQGRP